MDLISLIVVLIVLGVCWYLITKFIPLPEPIRVVVTVIAVLALCLVLLDFAGIAHFNIGIRH